MKTKTKNLRWQMMLVLLTGALGAWAQTSQTPTQDVCPGSEPYLVTPGNVANTFLWSISTGTAGLDWTITTPNTYSTNVVWANPIAPVTYRLTLTETNGSLCITSVYVDVTVYPSPLQFNVTGGGAYCSGGAGLPVGLANSQVGVNYQLQVGGVNTGVPVAGTGSAISFGSQTAAGTYTVVATSSSATACTSNMTGNAIITIDPLPTAYNVTGSGSYCTGGAGLPVGLANSEVGVNYQLQIGGVNTGVPVAGTGAAISFGNQTTAGTYTVIATSSSATACTNTMTGNAIITIDPLPTAFNVTGGGSYCTGGAGLPVGLANSQAGVNYQLQIGGVNTGVPVAGTGGAISFGNQTTAGTYTVIATSSSATACASNMIGNVIITIDPLPNAYNVTGGGSYCAGGTGLPVGLANSEVGVNYQLQIGGVNIGGPVSGTGVAISFGNQTTAGTYTVIATSSSATACTNNMTGNAIIIINALPTTSAIFHN